MPIEKPGKKARSVWLILCIVEAKRSKQKRGSRVKAMSCQLVARSSRFEVRISWHQLFCEVYFSRGTLPTQKGVRGKALLGDLVGEGEIHAPLVLDLGGWSSRKIRDLSTHAGATGLESRGLTARELIAKAGAWPEKTAVPNMCSCTTMGPFRCRPLVTHLLGGHGLEPPTAM